jgi:hypothetical protein
VAEVSRRIRQVGTIPGELRAKVVWFRGRGVQGDTRLNPGGGEKGAMESVVAWRPVVVEASSDGE